jgi:prepilin-type N-terminal cleavage/methylation domain-containing protein
MKREGFTLVELLIVIAIIGVLSSSAIFNLNIGRQKARDSIRLAELRVVTTALDTYYSFYEVYPCGDGDETGTFPGSSDGTVDSTWSTGFIENNSPATNCSGSYDTIGLT